MSGFDLKPLSAKAIDDLKIGPDQLWEVKIDENIYGPFETLQLKHYSRENRQVMLKAFVSPMSIDNWRPFVEVREFNHESHYTGPYWILWQGQKTAPLSKAEVAKRIELGTITRHDEISEDDGRHWHRISTHPEFEDHFTTGISLPESPSEVVFQRSREQVLEQLEARTPWNEEKDSMASFTHSSLVIREKTKTLNAEDYKMPVSKSDGPSFWDRYKTAVIFATPVAAMIMVFVMRNPQSPPAEIVTVDSTEKVKVAPTPRRSRKDNWERTPATSSRSVPSYERSALTQRPSMEENYPTVIETHQDEPDNGYPDPAAESEQIAEIRDQEEKAEEYSLVQPLPGPDRDPAEAVDEQNLDATMNNEPQEQPNPAVDQPVVEEVSDF